MAWGGQGIRPVNQFTPDYDNFHRTNDISNYVMPYRNRTARVYLKDKNHMQSTPERRHGLGKTWHVQFERVGVYKTGHMGWTYNNDSASKTEIEFATLEDAISFVHCLGVGYDVMYPHFRYHKKKNYAENFNWRGFPQEEDDIA